MRANQTAGTPQTRQRLHVDVVDRLTTSDFRRRYLEADRPVIIKGGAADWSAVHKWSPDFLKEQFGNHPVKARFLPHGVSSAIDANDRPEKPRTMAQFVDTMRAQPADGLWYLVQQPIPDLPEAMVRDFGTLAYNSRAMQVFTGHKPYFWMGSTGSMTGLHYDLIHNFNIQIAGRKAWRLYPRTQQHLLYFGHGDYPHHSIANIFHEDLSEYPLLDQATPLDFVLDPGDILFFPAGWPHSVYSFEETISINFFSLWCRLDDLKIMFREAPPWIYRKMAARVHSLLPGKPQTARAPYNSR